MFASVFAVLTVVGASVAQSSTPRVVCVAGQCLQGFTNITIGTTISAAGSPASLLLLPGQYSASTNPQLLHQVITSSSPSLSPSPGFESQFALPLNVAVQPGVVSYAQANYSGQATFTPLPNGTIANASTPVTGSSLVISSNTWAVMTSGSSKSRLIVWDNIPDMSQLPSSLTLSSLSMSDLQSSACSPPCASSGVCSASGTCQCAPGFNGTSCESCAPGFFGPTCSPCPAGCASCDEGISGSGRCLSSSVTNPPSSCNCLNGQCGANGQCTCNAGWQTSTNGTQCASCAPGFFLTTDGNCKVCNLGCSQCADNSGDCVTCQSGFTQNANDRTSCIAPSSTTSTGTVCPDGSFSSGTTCSPCSPSCQTCKGPLSSDCIICGSARFSLNGTCVQTDANGACIGTGQSSFTIADNNKHECDTCPAKCTTCAIPGFNVASTINQLQCTGCLPGFVLSKGQCVQSCPSGTFLSPQDNLTCTACDSSCGTCAGSATFCLTCENNLLASQGKCVNTCPSGSLATAGACTTCHPDCASCSGTAFNQCSTCPPSRPVLSGGRCLPTCSKSQFIDPTTSTCQNCDASCSSCSGSGPSSCLACSSATSVLRDGTCVTATCTSNSSVVPGLGMCLSDLVSVPQPSGTSTPAPLPTIPGLNQPAAQASSRRPLAWWEILLMALGCAFIFLVILMLWRRRMRKRRAQRTAMFASNKKLDRTDWRFRLVRFGERLFGHNASRRVQPEEAEADRMLRMRDVEEARHERDLEKIIGSYDDRSSNRSRGVGDYFRHSVHTEDERTNRLSGPSLYSQVTGKPRSGPEPRQPVRVNPPNVSRFSASASSLSSSSYSARTRELAVPKVKPPTPAEEYAMSVMDSSSNTDWLEPHNTGGSRNPFRR
ncbi:growth factor receptor domain-containing protein [Rickenella mellea]|uniref:Growth factor receptor domain-containing protein n=1 Tax=Rickenella mellea TaxID=50990 RepID=A0A4Y7PZ82_9AGAM|nr:growth factor receptor domain-containing protein [Rickenella mellea]